MVIAHTRFPSPHLHIIHSYSPVCKVHQETASRKPSQEHMQYTLEEWAYYATQFPKKSPRPSFPPNCHPKASSIQKFWSPPCLPELNSNITFSRKHTLDAVPHPSRTDHVAIPLNTHLAPVLLFQHLTMIVFKIRITLLLVLCHSPQTACK